MMTDMTDEQVASRISALLAWRPLESWQAVLASAVAVFVAATVTLVVSSPDPAAAVTIVSSVTRAEIVLADGTSRPATIGAKVPNRATLRTGQGGGARLTTEGRDVYVGGLSTVKVLDGVNQELDRGQVMVNATSGPKLTLATSAGAGTVRVPSGALARVEQNVSTLRLAVFRGSASITAEGRQATSTVTALHQVRAPYGGVPEPETALALTIKNGAYDVWEQLLVADLVSNDVDLNSFARALDGSDGQSVLQAAPVVLRDAPLQGRQGEQALTVAVAQKARLFSDVRDNLQEVQRDRGDGGSWGVVAAIVRARVSDVTSVLGSSLDDAASPAVVALPSPGTRPGAGGSDGNDGTGGPGTRPTHKSGKPTQSPSSNPVTDAVKGVTDRLPTPTPTPSVTPPATPAPAPSSIGGVVGSILGLLVH